MSRFSIRPYQLEDIEEVYQAADESRSHVRRWMSWMSWMTPDYSLKDAETWVQHAISSWEKNEAYEHVIIDSEDGQIVGSCGLNHINRIDMFCNLGYWVRTSALGQGAAVAATLLLRDFAFRELSLSRLEIVVAEGNLNSQRVAEKANAIYEGVLRSRLRVAGLSVDAHMYALIKESV